jgi:SAM-dependent methyltransferase
MMQDTGKIVAVDLEPRFVEGIKKPNLEIRRQDITKDKLEPETYDLIHTRVVLMHVLDRPAALNNMLAALKPNGWLLLEEADFSTFNTGKMETIERDTIQRLAAASKQTIVNLGGDPELGTKLPFLMQNADLQKIDTDTNTAMFRGDSDRSQIWRMAIAQITSKLLETELVNRSDLARFFDLIVREDMWMMDYAIVAAWGQKNSFDKND